MNYKLSSLPNSEVEVHVTLPSSEFEPYLKRAALLISEQVEIEGFRRGKAPYDIVKNRMGEGKIYEEAAELAVRKSYAEVLEKVAEEKKKAGENFLPIGKPEVVITKLAPGNELEYKIRLALLPGVELPRYQDIARSVRKDKREVAVTDEEVQKTLAWLQNSRTKFITVDRAAGEGDAVEIDFEVRHGSVRIEDGDSRNHPLVIGKGKFIPGFEDYLIGMRAGEEKNFALKAPDDWHEKNVAGKSLDFKVIMKVVQDQEKPGLNDEFAKTIGNFESLEALRQSIRGGMVQEKEEKERGRIRILMIEEIAKKADIEVPPVLINAEAAKMLEELRSGVTNMGMKWEDYLTHIKKKPDDLAKEWRNDAEKRVKIALTLRAIGEKEHMNISEEEIKNRADQFLARFRTARGAEKEVDPQELREYTGGVLRNEKVFELLEKI